MAPDRSFSGVNRDALRPRPQGDVPTGERRDPFFQAVIVEPVIHLTGSGTGTVTSIALKHGDMLVSDLGIPTPVALRSGEVIVVMSVPSGAVDTIWTLTIQVKTPDNEFYEDYATFGASI